MFKSLTLPNYRIFFVTRGLSLIGSFVQSTTLLWLVYRLTDSAFYVALSAFAEQGASFILSPFAGVLADRLHKRNLIMYTQIMAMLVAFALALLTYTEAITIGFIVFARLILGITDGIEQPVRQAFIYDLVENKSYLPNAIALHSSLLNISRMIGPALAGFLIPQSGESFCFFINGISFLSFILGLYALKNVKQPTLLAGPFRFFDEIREGIAYSFHFVPIKLILLLVICTSLFGFSYSVLLPVFATKVLEGGTKNLGLMQTVTAVGALLGTFFLAAKKTALGIERPMLVSSVAYGVLILLFAYSRYFEASLALLFGIGCAQLLVFSSSRTLLQLIVEEDKRGRVSSLYICLFKGCVALGGLVIGWAADIFGASHVLLVSGGFCALASLLIGVQLHRVQFNELITR